MQYLIATTFEVVHYIVLQAVHYKPLQEVHLSRYNQIKKLLPLREMAENFGLVRKSMRPKLGRKSFFLQKVITSATSSRVIIRKMFSAKVTLKFQDSMTGVAGGLRRETE